MKKFYNLIPGQPGEESRLYIDGEIVRGQDYTDFWTASRTKGAQTFRNELAQCGPVTVYINSPGGDVFAGAAMYSALLDHPHKVTVKIMGIAASAASVVAMAGDEVLISPVGYMMIHDPWSYVVGNAREMEHEAQVLREIGEGIVNAYTRKTGKTPEEIKNLLAAETYMNAQSAIENGFCASSKPSSCSMRNVSRAECPQAKMRKRAGIVRSAPSAPCTRTLSKAPPFAVMPTSCVLNRTSPPSAVMRSRNVRTTLRSTSVPICGFATTRMSSGAPASTNQRSTCDA